MTKNIMTKLAKKANVNIESFDSVMSWLNENETFIITCFYVTEVCGGEKRRFLRGSTKTSLMAVLKRFENECDYFTDGIQWKFNIN